jgi:hypothetical protein
MARPSTFPIDLLVQRFVATEIGDIVGTIGRAFEEFANSRTSKQLQEFVEQMAQGPTAGARLAANEKLARAMQDSVIRSWGQARRKLRPAVYNPVRTSRFSGGIDKIVHASYLAVATPRGVEFGPVALMDRDAAQWARINVGASPTGEGTHEVFPVRFSNLPTLEFVLDEPARPGYGLPVGNFKGPDGRWQRKGEGIPTGAFYPARGKQQFPTKGNVGFHMLDAGVRRFFTEFPTVYGGLFDELLPNRRGRRPQPFERKTISSPRR